MVAVMLVFREDVVELSSATLESHWHRKMFETPKSKVAWSNAARTIPVVVLGLGFKEFIKNEVALRMFGLVPRGATCSVSPPATVAQASG